MKRSRFITVIVFAILLIVFSGVETSAEGGEEYIVSYAEGEYILSYGADSCNYSSFEELVESLPSESSVRLLDVSLGERDRKSVV